MDLKKIIKDIVNEFTSTSAPVKEPGVKPATPKEKPAPRERPNPIRHPGREEEAHPLPKGKKTKSEELFYAKRKK
jgi:hypothetical protein